jgi:hypothetical protein
MPVLLLSANAVAFLVKSWSLSCHRRRSRCRCALTPFTNMSMPRCLSSSRTAWPGVTSGSWQGRFPSSLIAFSVWPSAVSQAVLTATAAATADAAAAAAAATATATVTATATATATATLLLLLLLLPLLLLPSPPPPPPLHHHHLVQLSCSASLSHSFLLPSCEYFFIFPCLLFLIFCPSSSFVCHPSASPCSTLLLAELAVVALMHFLTRDAHCF